MIERRPSPATAVDGRPRGADRSVSADHDTACPMRRRWRPATYRLAAVARRGRAAVPELRRRPVRHFVRGGGALLFGDMLGERRMGAAVQVGNRLRDAAFTFRFLNQERRWNWGALGELEPSVIRYRRSEADRARRPAGAAAAGRLPAAHAVARGRGRRVSVQQRAARGVHRRRPARHLSSRSAHRRSPRARPGKVLATDQVESAGGLPTTVAEVSAALVTTRRCSVRPDRCSDRAIASRWRRRRGQLSYTSVTADSAVRDADPSVFDRRSACCIRPLRRRRQRSAAAVELPRIELLRARPSPGFCFCRPDTTRVCGDDLLGSRLLVGNVEVRVPLWGSRADRSITDCFPPTRSCSRMAGMAGGAEATISSFGGGLRVNAMGFPLEIAAIRARATAVFRRSRARIERTGTRRSGACQPARCRSCEGRRRHGRDWRRRQRGRRAMKG